MLVLLEDRTNIEHTVLTAGKKKPDLLLFYQKRTTNENETDRQCTT